MGSSVILPAAGQPVEGPDPSFKTGSIPSSVSFLFDGIGPPASLFVQQDDILQMVGISELAAETLTYNIRFLHTALPVPGQPDATPSQQPVITKVSPYIGLYQFQVQITSARAIFLTRAALGEGFILSVDVQASNATTRGVTFTRAEIFRGVPTVPGQLAQLFLSDYVTTRASTCWPGSTIKHFLEGPGNFHSLQVPNPAAGSDWTLTVLANQRLRIQSFAAVLTTSAAVANRNVQIIVDDGANIYWTHDAAVTQAASTTDTYVATGTNAPTGVITTIQSMVIPPGQLLPVGHRIRTLTGNIQAADQWSAIWLGVEEWIDS